MSKHKKSKRVSRLRSKSLKKSGVIAARQQDLLTLLRKCGSLQIDRIPSTYKDEFRRSLDYKSLGFAKFMSFLKTVIPFGAIIKPDPLNKVSKIIELKKPSVRNNNPDANLPPSRSVNTTDTAAEIQSDDKLVEIEQTLIEAPSWLRPERLKAYDTIAATKQNVLALLRKYGALDVNVILRTYEDEFQRRLDYKSLGFSRLTSFLKTLIPCGAVIESNPFNVTSPIIKLTSHTLSTSMPNAMLPPSRSVNTTDTAAEIQSDDKLVEIEQTLIEAPSWLRPERLKAYDTIAATQQNVLALLRKYGALDVNVILRTYEDEFKHDLDYESLGFAKLIAFLNTLIPCGAVIESNPFNVTSPIIKLTSHTLSTSMPNAMLPPSRSVNTTDTAAEIQSDDKLVEIEQTLIEAPSWLRPERLKAYDTIAATQQNVLALLRKYGALDVNVILRTYKDEFKHDLDYESLGFAKLITFLKTLIPCGAVIESNPFNVAGPIVKLKSNWIFGCIPDAMSAPSKRVEVLDRVAEIKPDEEQTEEKDCMIFEVAATYADMTKDLRRKYDTEQSSIQDAEGLLAYFKATASAKDSVVLENHTSLVGQESMSQLDNAALLGTVTANDVTQGVYLNTHAPFCFAAVGVQGTGKSHSLGCVLESCLLPLQVEGVLHLKKSMTCLVLHYDQNTSSICEATGLLSPDERLESYFNKLNTSASVPKSKAIVLVSPTFYKQRKAFYGDYCTVKPLLFKWNTLTADHIKRIMCIQEGDSQLYVASFLNILRGYQRRGVMPKFSDFMSEVKKVCSVGSQVGPLEQRIALLESIIADSEVNKDIREESFDLASTCNAGYALIVADMTDALLSKNEANSLFQVLTEQFRALPLDNGKLLALDEAHKFMDGISSDGLSQAIVNVARLMRHDGMRLAVSTQSPKALAPELLELVTVALMHRFHSRDWWTYLKSKLPLMDNDFDEILKLQRGHALAFAASHSFQDICGRRVLSLQVRPRFTADRGASVTNQ